LALTTKKLYNFKYRKEKLNFRWSVKINEIHGVSKSVVYGSKEFVIHCPTFYDIRYQSRRREDIINALKLAFISLTKTDLPIYGIQSKDLREYTTLEKDKEKGKSRIPDKSLLIDEENVMKKNSKGDRNSGEPVVEEGDDEEWDICDGEDSNKNESAFLFDIEEDKEDFDGK